ncbi:hypothetical protein Pcac1_g10694 [Phytophthora cactorum]|nr:hypothetical protein Pcac1_g10694 [Phytophthora cactorum]
MAFLEDDDAVRAFEAALSFVEQYSIDTSLFTASPATAGASSAALLLVDDIELLSPSLTPLTSTLPTNYASPGAGSDTSMTSPSSPAFRLSKDPSARLELGLPAAGTVSTKRKTVGRGRKKTTGGPKKPVTRGDPNRARNERKIELAYLREKVSQLELELRALKLHPRTQTRAIRHQGDKQRTEAMKKDSESDSIMSVYDPVEGAEKHRGNMYEGKVAKHLEAPDTPETIIEDFAKEFFADSALCVKVYDSKPKSKIKTVVHHAITV